MGEHLTYSLDRLADLLILAVSLYIFWRVLGENARAIIGFHRAAQYDKYDTTQTVVGSGASIEVKAGEPIPDSKMILWWVMYYSEKLLGKFWSKPVCTCPICMASIHGLIPFLLTAWVVTGLSWWTLAHWAFYTLALAGHATELSEK